MNEIKKRFGWRLRKVYELIEEKNYKDAFSEYSVLVKLFNRLEGYSDDEKLNFYRKIKRVGDNFLFKLFKDKLSEVIKKEKFSSDEFKKKLQMLTKKNLNEDICNLIKKEKFEEALRKFYENE